MDNRLVSGVCAMASTAQFTFLFCYFSDKTTRLMFQIGDKIYNSDWYHCPLNLRKYPILIMIRSQDEIHFSGLKMVHCHQSVFLQVMSFFFNFKNDIKTFFYAIRIFEFLQLTKTAVSYVIMFQNLKRVTTHDVYSTYK